MTSNRPIVTITRISANYARYFDWLVTGLGEMQSKGEIDYRLDLQPVNRLLGVNGPRWLIRRILPRVFAEVDGSAVLEGTIRIGGKSAKFCYDIDDRPFWFDLNLLQDTDLYFKAQMPVNFPEPFRLAENLTFPLASTVLDHREKVRPAMLGRPLARSLKPAGNRHVLDAWRKHGESEPTGSLFAYFGGVSEIMMKPMVMECGKVGSREPRSAAEGAAETATYRQSGRFGHPNHKRLELVRLLRSWNDPRVNARMIGAPDPALTGRSISRQLDFARTLGAYDWNCNITGLFGSIPFRFADAFAMDRGIVTDDLLVKWYRPFEPDCEVRQLGSMGYELPEAVDWRRAEHILREAAANSAGPLARERRSFLRARYDSMWSPLAFSRYLVGSCAEVL